MSRATIPHVLVGVVDSATTPQAPATIDAVALLSDAMVLRLVQALVVSSSGIFVCKHFMDLLQELSQIVA